MHAMILETSGEPLRKVELPIPSFGPNDILLKVCACGVCRTDLHILDGELAKPKLPLILGHEIVGKVVAKGERVERFKIGDRLGVPWLGHTCGHCKFCISGRENLCDEARFTGFSLDGGYAEYAVADQYYGFLLPENYSDAEAAPLLCAGMIGYRALVAAGNAKKIGIYGFGAAAHIITQVAHWQGRKIFAFTRPGDTAGQDFAKKFGASWAGDSTEAPPTDLDAVILFAPVGPLVPQALRYISKGGTVVCAGIHMSDIPSFPYSLLWGERTIRSIANLTRLDGEEFFKIVSLAKIKIEIETFHLEEANKALKSLRDGRIRGAAVLIME
ncbi:MAG: zinc-dependent alcohol dehydrogenase family protein [Bacteriovorax sp.]|nr:zinc-dependent alcohol dehydrogenase family protein [Bacteriovorax sp.]